MYYLQETHFKYKDTYRFTVKGWRKIYHTNTNQKKVTTAILISDRAETDFGARKVFRAKEGHNLMIKGSIFQEDINNP